MHAGRKPHTGTQSGICALSITTTREAVSPSVAAVSRPQRAARQSQMLRMLPESTCPSFQMQMAISSSSMSGRSSS